mgnify:CR=1 FL=1
MKKSVLFLVSLILATGLLFAGGQQDEEDGETREQELEAMGFSATGYPVVTDSPTFRVMARRRRGVTGSYEESPKLLYLEEQTGVKVDWETIQSANAEEQINVVMASGDLPDAFYYVWQTQEEPRRYGADNQIIPLNDLIDQYAPNLSELFSEKTFLRALNSDVNGNIYSTPSGINRGYTVTGQPFINTTWLERVGMDMPQTTDELTQILRAFQEQDANGNGDPDDEIPLSFNQSSWEPEDISRYFPWFGVPDNDEHMFFQDGEAVFTADKPEYRAAIEYLHMLASERLLDWEGYTYDQQVFRSKINNDLIGVMPGWRIVNIGIPEAEGHFEPIPYLEAPNDAEPMWPRYFQGGNISGVSISPTAEYPEVLMRWADFGYAPENSIIMREAWGSLQFTDDGSLQLTSEGLIDYRERGDMTDEEWAPAPGPGVAAFVSAETFDEYYPPRAVDREKNSFAEILEPYLTETPVNIPLPFSPDEIDRIALLGADVRSYVDETQARWIIDGGIEDEWDDYLDQLDRIGLEEYVDIFQAAFDRYQSFQDN